MSNDVALKSLRREIDSLRASTETRIAALGSPVIKRYHSGHLLPPAHNVPRGSSDADRFCTNDVWNGESFQLTTVPTTIPGMRLEKIKPDPSASAIKIQLKFLVTYEAQFTITIFRIEWTMRSYLDGSLVSTYSGIGAKSKASVTGSDYRTNDQKDLEFSFRYLPWDNTASPTFNADGDLPIKGLPTNRSIELDIRVVGREADSGNAGSVYGGQWLYDFPDAGNYMTWINDDGTTGTTSSENIVPPYCELIEYI